MKARHMACAAALLACGCTTPPDAMITRSNARRGADLVEAYGCIACHEMPAKSPAGRVGPALAGIGRQQYLAGRIPNTPANMIRWIRHPREIDDRTVMPDMNVTADDARDIAEYLYSLR